MPASNDNDSATQKAAQPLGATGREPLSPAARRALAEAEERRHKQAAEARERELGGRGGLDPARFGDWEIDGRAIDF
jgi:hypothetical protein